MALQSYQAFKLDPGYGSDSGQAPGHIGEFAQYYAVAGHVHPPVFRPGLQPNSFARRCLHDGLVPACISVLLSWCSEVEHIQNGQSADCRRQPYDFCRWCLFDNIF